MKFVTFILDGVETIGILTRNEKRIVKIKDILGENAPNSLVELIENFSDEYRIALNNMEGNYEEFDIDKVIMKAPIPVPRRGVICLGKNYREHVKEVPSNIDFKNGVPEHPIYFLRLVDEAVGHGGNILLNSVVTNKLDYEAELAVVIGKEGKNIPKDKVEDYIFGYTIINDISARDTQAKHVQWFYGKSLDGTCPMGPCIVDRSDINFPPELDIKSYVNGELRQNSNTREFIFDIPYIISEFSKGVTLKPGDIIATGTPAGVGMGFRPERFLKDGDEVTCFIEGIGILRNTVVCQ